MLKILIITFMFIVTNSFAICNLEELKSSTIYGWNNKTKSYITEVVVPFEYDKIKFQDEKLLFYLIAIMQAKKEFSEFFSSKMSAEDKVTLDSESSFVSENSNNIMNNIYILDSTESIKNNKLEIIIKLIYNLKFKKQKYIRSQQNIKQWYKINQNNFGIITTQADNKGQLYYLVKIPQKITKQNPKYNAKIAAKVIAAKFIAAITNSNISTKQDASISKNYDIKYASSSMEKINVKGIKGLKYLDKKYDSKSKVFTMVYKIKL